MLGLSLVLLPSVNACPSLVSTLLPYTCLHMDIVVLTLLPLLRYIVPLSEHISVYLYFLEQSFTLTFLIALLLALLLICHCRLYLKLASFFLNVVRDHPIIALESSLLLLTWPFIYEFAPLRDAVLGYPVSFICSAIAINVLTIQGLVMINYICENEKKPVQGGIRVRDILLVVVLCIVTCTTGFLITYFITFSIGELIHPEFQYVATLFGCTRAVTPINLTAGQTVLTEWYSNTTVCVGIGSKSEFSKFNMTEISIRELVLKRYEHCMKLLSAFLKVFSKTYICSPQGQIKYRASKTATYYIVVLNKNYNVTTKVRVRIVPLQ